MADKLLPCPFCGGEVELVKQKSDEFEFVLVSCKNCDATIGIGGSDNEQKVTEAWNNRHSLWHTGTPTDTGWYLLYYPKSEEQPYELAQWDGEHFVAVKPFHAIVVRIEASTVPYWQKIEEKNNG